MRTLRAVTRGSRLALVQTQLAIEALQKAHAGLSIEIQTVRTAGDQQTDVPLWKLEGAGFFTSQLEEALLSGQADLAVHSYKDLPTEMPADLQISAVLQRFHPEDVLICRQPASSLEEVPTGVRIGTSSVRRAAQLRHLRPDLELAAIRGNVETRVRKLEAGEYDAIVLARAGLDRLGIRNWKGFCFDPRKFVPAPAQGAIAVQTRSDDGEVIELIRAVHDEETGHATAAERRVLERLHPGCHGPVGAYAKIEDRQVRLTAFAADPSGSPFLKEEICGRRENAIDYAARLADVLLSQGARDILENYG